MANIIEITDFSARELDVYARLTENQLVNHERSDEGLSIAESPRSSSALVGGCVPDYELPLYAKILNVSVEWLLGMTE